MSGQLYRFKLADSSTNISDLLKSEKITSVDSGEVLNKYCLQCDSHVSCRESLYGLLQRLDAEFVKLVPISTVTTTACASRESFSTAATYAQCPDTYFLSTLLTTTGESTKSSTTTLS